jgi:hypothetical protein
MEETKKPTQTNYETWNIYKKMLHIENELEKVKKSLDIKLPNGTYKAVGEVDVLDAVKPLEFKYGVKSLPINREIVETKEIVNKSGTINQFVRFKVYFQFINVDNPTDTITVISFGDGLDSGDKAPGKGQTYADKYALLKSYKIATGEDPDVDGSKEYVKTPRKNTDEVIKQAMENNTIEKAPEAKMTPKQIAIITMYSKHFGDQAGKIALDYMKAHNVAKSKDLTETQSIELIRDLSELDNGDIVIKYESEKK